MTDFDWNGISLIEGEITDDSYPLVSICAFAEGAYERSVAEAKDSESFEEADGVITFVDSIGERQYLLMVDGKVPATVVFAESIDREKADEIMSTIHIEAR